ncbi:MAG: YlxR family protein [Acidimicrobiaceae bacterium]|nr:YlxR family protein [Acidimicrobiaceae bacterium]MYE96714.1 YlxR family protein [Acidimicrobiaceae bacterium]MYH44880.1 YlxR family protein [Acidimicrobiaceae bacterium]MYI55148.1 YlxR family protein [Acidimicrobiaceae bacterium]
MRRVRRDASGALVVGPGSGRGAWLCADVACFESARRRRAFRRALRADVEPGEIARLQRAWPSDPGSDPGLGGRAGQTL